MKSIDGYKKANIIWSLNKNPNDSDLIHGTPVGNLLDRKKKSIITPSINDFVSSDTRTIQDLTNNNDVLSHSTRMGSLVGAEVNSILSDKREGNTVLVTPKSKNNNINEASYGDTVIGSLVCARRQSHININEDSDDDTSVVI